MHNLSRLIDANLNRTLEGLRVCEDIARFILDDKGLWRSLKLLRQKIGALGRKLSAGRTTLLKSRNIKKDIGKESSAYEKKRKNVQDIFQANIQRVKESLRVLEEALKLSDIKTSEKFKKIRFRIYEIEKKSRNKVEALLHH